MHSLFFAVSAHLWWLLRRAGGLRRLLAQWRARPGRLHRVRRALLRWRLLRLLLLLLPGLLLRLLLLLPGRLLQLLLLLPGRLQLWLPSGHWLLRELRPRRRLWHSAFNTRGLRLLLLRLLAATARLHAAARLAGRRRARHRLAPQPARLILRGGGGAGQITPAAATGGRLRHRSAPHHEAARLV